MGQLILCKSPRADAPFYIESGKVNIYSLEELMYYVHTARFVGRDDFMKGEFADWVERELHMEELAVLLRGKLNGKLADFFLPIEAANGYLTTAELQALNEKLRMYDHMTGLEAKKLYADSYMRQEKYVQAIYAYRRLLNDPAVIEKQGHMAGDIWSNLGCAYARLQDFAEAVDCFARGYMLNRRIETLQQAVAAACLSGDEALLESLVMRFAASADQIAQERVRMEQLLSQTVAAAENSHWQSGQLLQWIESYRSQCES